MESDSYLNFLDQIVHCVSKIIENYTLYRSNVHNSNINYIGHCPSGDDPFTTVNEEDCYGLTQYPGGKLTS